MHTSTRRPTAMIDGSVYSHYGKPEPVQIRKSSAAHGRATCAFYAPGWRAMHFTTIEAAMAKMEKHPGFIAWVAQ